MTKDFGCFWVDKDELPNFLATSANILWLLLKTIFIICTRFDGKKIKFKVFKKKTVNLA